MNVPAPHWENLPLAKLTIDPEVQRSLDKTRVNRMVKDYQPQALGALVVSRRQDGTIHVIDGQHRLAASIAAGYGDREVSCLVFEGLSKPQEAMLFRQLNNTRTPQSLDKFRVRVIEGDEVAVALNTILEAHGWHAAQSKDDSCFAAVAALEKVYRGKLNGEGDTATICDTLIRVITKAWDFNADGVRAELIGGLGALLLRFNTRVDLSKLTTELGQTAGGPLGLIGRAKSLRDLRGGTIPDALAEIVVEMLNKSRRTNRLPHWRSGVN